MKSTITLLALALAAVAAQAANYSFQQGLAGYAGAVDTQLRASDADATHGTAEEIGVDASDGGMPTQALLRFDGVFGNGAGQVPLNAVITQATLTVEVTSAGSGFALHEMLQSWNGATIAWNGMLAGIQADGSEAAAAALLQVGTNDSSGNIGEGPLVLDFSAALRRVQDGSAPGLGWALLPLLPDGTNGIDFLSAESLAPSMRPLLQVTALPVPEPSAALLLGGGLLALALRRKRR